jgi:hypothetical protein
LASPKEAFQEGRLIKKFEVRRNRMKRATLMLVAVALLLGGAGRAKADLIITFAQSGSNVVANGAGSLNFAGLTYDGQDLTSSYVDASAGAVLLGSSNTGADIYGSISGPTTFGPGPQVAADSSSSTAPQNSGAGVDGATHQLLVPASYLSGNPFTVSATWDNTTISGLGLTPGTYTWTWGSGSNADSLEVIIPGAVPEPSSVILLLTTVLAVAFVTRKRIAQRL